MNAQQRQQMLELLRNSFSEAFMNTDSDDLDVKEVEYLEERI